jgi:alpha-1,3-glucan synthase
MRKYGSPDISRSNSVASFQDMAAIANEEVPRYSIQEGNENNSEVIIPPPTAHLPDRISFTPSLLGPSALSQDESLADPFSPPFHATKSKSVLSLQSIVGEQKDFHLQKTDPFFTDTTGVYYHNFEKMLDGVDSKNSTDRYCIEKFLEKSERQWFGQRHNAKLGLSTFSTPRSSFHEQPGTPQVRDIVTEPHEVEPADDLEQFSLGHDFVPIKGIGKFLQRKIGDWQIYSLILAFVSLCSIAR